MSDQKEIPPAEVRRLQVTLSAPDQRPWLSVRVDVMPPGATLYARAPDGSELSIQEA